MHTSIRREKNVIDQERRSSTPPILFIFYERHWLIKVRALDGPGYIVSLINQITSQLSFT
jgi:hypothetical protein